MRVYLDFDSTLVDLIDGWIKWLKKEKFIKVSTKDILYWDWLKEHYGEHANQYFKIEGIYERDINPIPGAVEFVLALKQLYGTENIFILSSSARNMIDEKEAYAEKYFNISRSNFLHSDKKYEYTSDGVLVDDAPHNILEHVKENTKPGILFNYRDRYGWAVIKNPSWLITKCINYSQCLDAISRSEKFFVKE